MSELIVIGMARSGTTLVAHLLGCSQETYCEIEPHILWKTGDFSSLADDHYTIKPKRIDWIRTQLRSKVKNKILVEKSPPNCLRPKLVHSVFPDAKIIYIDRDPVRCINSNYKRSKNRDSLKWSIILKKYILFAGSSDLAGAIGKRTIFNQLRIGDIISFSLYFCRLFYLKNFLHTLPFGPKINNFSNYIKKNGLLRYHVNVYMQSLKHKNTFKSLYGKKMEVFKLEGIQSNVEEIRRLYDFCELQLNDEEFSEATKAICSTRTSIASEKGEFDNEIISIMSAFQYSDEKQSWRI